MATRNELFVLWLKTGKKGTEFLSGKAGRDGFNLIAFFNGTKKNPKEPDLVVYIANSDGSRGDEYASLWCNVSEKTGVKYLTGYLNTPDRAKITGFIKKETDSEKAPYVKAYFQSDLDAAKPKAEPKPEQPKNESKPKKRTF